MSYQTFTAQDLVDFFRSPIMSNDVQYALLADLKTRKPSAYPNLSGLARRIHRDRGNRALQLSKQTIRFQDRFRNVVEVLAIDETSGAIDRIGFAWIAHADLFTAPQLLQLALDAEITVSVEAAR